MNHPHPLANCPLCSAVDAMKQDDKRQREYFLTAALDYWMNRPRATTSRDPFRFSEDDVLDAHLALKSIDRIPSEWRL